MQNGHRSQSNIFSHDDRAGALVDHDFGAAPDFDFEVFNAGQQRGNRRWSGRRDLDVNPAAIDHGGHGRGVYMGDVVVDDRSHGLGGGEAGVI